MTDHDDSDDLDDSVLAGITGGAGTIAPVKHGEDWSSSTLPVSVSPDHVSHEPTGPGLVNTHGNTPWSEPPAHSTPVVTSAPTMDPGAPHPSGGIIPHAPTGAAPVEGPAHIVGSPAHSDPTVVFPGHMNSSPSMDPGIAPMVNHGPTGSPAHSDPTVVLHGHINAAPTMDPGVAPAILHHAPTGVGPAEVPTHSSTSPAHSDPTVVIPGHMTVAQPGLPTTAPTMEPGGTIHHEPMGVGPAVITPHHTTSPVHSDPMTVMPGTTGAVHPAPTHTLPGSEDTGHHLRGGHGPVEVSNDHGKLADPKGEHGPSETKGEHEKGEKGEHTKGEHEKNHDSKAEYEKREHEKSNDAKLHHEKHDHGKDEQEKKNHVNDPKAPPDTKSWDRVMNNPNLTNIS